MDKPDLIIAGPRFMALHKVFLEYGHRNWRRIKREIRKATKRLATQERPDE